jgi:hypothetical protein
VKEAVRNIVIDHLAKQTGGYNKDYRGPLLPIPPAEGATRQQRRYFDRKSEKLLKHLQNSKKG